MIGLILTLIGTLCMEAQDSLGKNSVQQKRQSIYTMGFLSLFWSSLFFLFSMVFIKKAFVFSLASLPTFFARAILEVALAHVSILAITRADRSTYSLIRIGTIPLLLATDILLGYTLSAKASLGIGIIMAALLFLFSSRVINKKGIGFVIYTAIAGAVTLSLFKWNITHFNSVEAEQSLINAILLVYFFLMDTLLAKENPFRFLFKPPFLFQSLFAGFGTVLLSFAYLFGTASVITAATRASSVLWSVISGSLYFHEKNLMVKLALFSFLTAGLILLAF